MKIRRQSFNTTYILLLKLVITKLYAMHLFNDSNIVFYSFPNLYFFITVAFTNNMLFFNVYVHVFVYMFS